MITFLLLMFVIAVIVMLTLLLLAAGLGAYAILFGDITICILIIVSIFKRKRRK